MKYNPTNLPTFLDPCVHVAISHECAYFLDTSIYVVTPYVIVGGGEFIQCTELSPRFARQQQWFKQLYGTRGCHLKLASVLLKVDEVECAMLLCDSLCSAGKTFIVMEDTETPSFQCKMCQTNASSFHHKVEIISCVLVVLSRLSLQSRSSWQNVSLFSQQKKLHWRIPK